MGLKRFKWSRMGLDFEGVLRVYCGLIESDLVSDEIYLFG